MAWVGLKKCTLGLGRILGTQSRCLHTTNPLNIVIPNVIEISGGGERSFDIFSRLLRERIICVFGTITEYSAALVMAQLLFLQSESPKKPINMYINSPVYTFMVEMLIGVVILLIGLLKSEVETKGGSITDGLAIYDTMQYIQAPVATWCLGQACSMGSLLLCAGSSGNRHSLPNSRIMIHQPSGRAFGTATDISIQVEEIVRMKKQTSEIYFRHTNMSMAKIEELIERDSFMTPEEAMNHGLLDKVHPPTKQPEK